MTKTIRVVWIAAVAGLGCGGGAETPPAQKDVPTGAPATTTVTASAPSPTSSTPRKASPTKAVPKGPLLAKTRPLRTGEQAAAEETLGLVDRFDFAQAFRVDFGQAVGTCSFVPQLLPSAGSAPASSTGPATSAAAAPSASASPTPSASASALSAPSAAPTATAPSPSTGEGGLRFHLLCKGREPLVLPAADHVPASWKRGAIKAVSFPLSEGRRDIVVIAEMTTRIGPQAAQSFPVVYVYRQDDNAFVFDRDASDRATQNKAATVADVTALLREKE